MPHSVDTRPGKRDRLVASASELLHRQGVQRTTLAEIAEHADVPVGNVYYYFKTREDLVRAVVDTRRESIVALLAELGARATPRARLKALVATWTDVGDLVAAHGCPIGSLASELNKHDGDLGADSEQLFELLLTWCERQFRELGRKDAKTLAVALIGGVQGASLLADTFGDPKILAREIRRLERWIDELGA